MAKWAEHAASEWYRALPRAEREAARKQYFDEAIAPKYGKDQVPEVWAQFDQDTRSTLDDTGPEKKSTAGRISETITPALKTVQAVASGYPVAETAAHLATGAVAMPVAGIAGIGAAAARALGADVDPAAVVHKVGDALTYKPKTELGEHLTRATLYPLEKLSEGARHLGEKAQDAGASPVTATAIETAIAGGIPLLLPTAMKAAARQAPSRKVADHDLGNPEAKNTEMLAEAVEQREQAAQSTPVQPAVAPARVASPEAEAIASAERLIAQHEAERARGTAAEEGRPISAEPAPLGPEAAPDVPARIVETPTPAADLLGRPVDTIPDNLLRYVAEQGAPEARRIAQVELERRAVVEPTAGVNDRQTAATVRPETPPEGAGVGLDRSAEPLARIGMEQAGDVASTESAARILGKPVEAVSEGALRLVAERGTPELRAVAQRELDRRAGAGALTPSASDHHSRPNDGRQAPAEEVRNAVEFAQESPHRVRSEQPGMMGQDGDILNDVPVVDRATLPGAQHVSFISDAAETPTASTAPTKVIRREDVIAPLLKALDVSVYEGRIPGEKTLGYFRPKKEVIRTKHSSDMETTAHEIAHLIDDRVFNGFGTQKGVARSRPWIDGPEAKTYSAELRGVSYDRAKGYEGFAEFVRLWMTQPEKATAAAPKFSAWFDQFVASHEYGPALLKAREGMQSWFGQDALARAKSKIGEKRDINEFLDGFWDRFRQSTVDDLHGVYRMERDLRGEIQPRGAYETARLARASNSMVEGLLRHGRLFRKPDGSFEYVGKGLEQILEPVAGRLEDFMLYAVGRSARELKGQGREHLFTNGEINAMLALETPAFKKAFLDYQFWNKGVLDFAEQSGVLNPQTRAMWKRSEYLPFHRVGEGGSQRSMGGVQGNWQGVQKLTGGTENIRDVLGNIIGNAAMLIDVSLKNEARAKVAGLAENLRGGGHFMERIPPESRKVKIDRDQIRDKLMEAAGVGGRRGPGGQSQVAHVIDDILDGTPYLWDFLVKNQAPTGGNILAVLKDGKPTYYEVVDPILFRAVSALNRPAQAEIVKLLAIPKRIGQASITLTPDFAIANIARDTIMGSIMSRGGFRPVVDSIRGMVGRIEKDPAYKEYVANGGGFASYYVDESAFRTHLERFYSERGIDPKTVLDAPAKFLYFMENLFDSFEVSTRLGEYKRLREQGEHPRHAAYLAREVSTDFAMKGDSRVLGFFYDTVMFLRPAVVSMDRLYRGLAHDPNRGAIAAKSATLALASAGLYLHNRDNPKYQDLEDWDRDSYWHFFVPKPDGGELHFRYPKIWEVGAMATLAERSLERTLDAEPKEYAKDIARVIRHQFGLNFMPQAMGPAYEIATNRDSFTGRPIEPENLKRLQPAMRANPGTSDTMRALGKATLGLPEGLQISPTRAESLLRGYLNTWALYGLMASDSAFFGDHRPTRRLDEYPVVRRFYRDEPPLHTKHEAKFYELLEEATRLRNSVRRLRQIGEEEAAADIEKEPLLQQQRRLEGVRNALAAKRRQIEEIRASSFTPEEKRKQMDEITAERNALVKEVSAGVAGNLKRSEADATR